MRALSTSKSITETNASSESFGADSAPYHSSTSENPDGPDIDVPAHRPRSGESNRTHIGEIYRGVHPAEISVLHIDRNQLFREGLRRILSDSPFKVQGEAASLEDGVNQIPILNPHMIIIDTNSSNDSFTELMTGIGNISPRPRVVMLTDTVAIPRLAKALGAGLDGYLLKDMSTEALKQSLLLVQMGETVFPTNLASLLINNRFTALGNGGQPGRNGDLSERETEILACLVNGRSNKVIANRLEITEGTVKVHLKGILKKIHVVNRTQAAIWAIQHGIVAEVPTE